MYKRLLPILALIPSLSYAAERWSVLTSDFKSSAMVISKIDNKQVVATDKSESPSVSLESFVQATRSLKIDQPAGMVLCLAGGDRLIGQPRKLDGANLVWFAAGIGEVSVPIERAMGILRDKSTLPDLDADRGEDEIRLLNGDTVKGIVTVFAERSITITPTGGNAVEIPLDNIRDLLLAKPPQGRGEAKPVAFTLRLSTGSVVSCESLDLNGDKIKFSVTGGAKASVPTSIVAAIEHTGGPVTWLSTRTPSEVSYTPFFHGQFAPQMDRTVTGDPIRFGNQIIQRGIGMHSKTRMTFPILPGDLTFRSRYAIDPSLGYADVDVRVYLDGKQVHETLGFKAADPSPALELDISNSKTLTLEVDYGKGYDIQDRLTWIEPAIIRK